MVTCGMAKSCEARGSLCAASALSKERPKPVVSASLSTNLMEFGLGVGSISAILGMGPILYG
ncbi:hypothetical protein D3C86_2229440 [compost metagenome]